MGSDLVLILVVVAGLAFDFTNGFHDTANAMATSIATGALKPKVAVIISACLNFAGAFISISVAATIAKGIVNPAVLAGNDGLLLVLAALIGAMMWNLITWYFTIPSSSSHALIGGVIGATIVAASSSAVNWHNLVQSVIVPAFLSPIIAGVVAFIGVLTIPSAAILAGVAWEITDLFGLHSNLGALVIALLAVAGAFGLWSLAQRNKITAADLDRTQVAPGGGSGVLGGPEARPTTAGV